MTLANDTPTFEDVRAAAARIDRFVHRTPVLSCGTINRMAGTEIFFKCENFQKIGAFKIRGATNAIACLSEDQIRHGVATHSSGNHAAAVALAAASRGVKAHVVMPDNAPRVKREAVAGYGAEIVFCKPELAEREKTLSRVVRQTGARFIHPYDDPRVIEGQGTALLELVEEIPDLQLVLTPVGGGGLISGTALAARGLSASLRVIGVEPVGADDAYRSFKSGALAPSSASASIADGLLASLSARTFSIIRAHVEDVITVDEDSIVGAMRTVWERMKIVVEPSAAVPLAGLLAGNLAASARKVGIILSGGNVDLDTLPWTHPK